MNAGRARRGAVLLETLLALSLGVFVLGAFAGVLAACLHWTRGMIERSESLEAVRTVWVVLDEELRPGLHERDWFLGPEGIVTLRAFRGVARVCGPPDATGAWSVAFRGRRMADPQRDSVLVLGVDGGWRAFELERVEGGGVCVGGRGETLERWSWPQGDGPHPLLVRLYERGEYHLADRALRYRRGAGGRQPLTTERIGEASGFRPIAGGIEVVLEFEAPGVERALAPFVWPVLGMALEEGW